MRIRQLSLASAAILFTSCAAVAQPPPVSRTFTLSGPGGVSAGSATLTEAPKGVILRLELTGLTPGWHGVHFHEKGDCSAKDFTSAGSHVHGAAPVVHGLLNPAATDSGDLPNIYAGADGKAFAEMFSPFVSLKSGDDRPALMDADGSAVVVHANPDDYMTQPIGGAGARIACGVVK